MGALDDQAACPAAQHLPPVVEERVHQNEPGNSSVARSASQLECFLTAFPGRPARARRTLLAYVAAKKWWARGHGNFGISLESYTLGRDGLWHLLDAYGQKLAPFVMPLQVGAAA